MGFQTDVKSYGTRYLELNKNEERRETLYNDYKHGKNITFCVLIAQGFNVKI